MSPSDNSKYGSSILTDAEFEKMLANAERQDAINAKRQATRTANKAKKEAERLAQLPTDVNDAFWRAVDAFCPDGTSFNERRKIIRGMKVEFDGTIWTRHAQGMRSNSGKSISGWTITYNAADGRIVEWQTATKNRRNDSSRNWGAGRD